MKYKAGNEAGDPTFKLEGLAVAYENILKEIFK